MSKKCIGCGVTLQEEDKDKKGYTKSLEMDYCMRCFRWNHYRDFTSKEEVDEEEIIKRINEKNGFVFFFVDFLNLHEEAFSYFKKIKLPKVFVISKMDSIPKSIYLEKIKTWIRDVWDIKEEVLFIQKDSNSSIKKIEKKILESPKKCILFAGLTNAGKSTFLNSFFHFLDITVSEIPNTTLDFLSLSMGDFTIYDTPGIPYHYFEKGMNFLKKANVKKEIKPKNYPLKKEASLIIENQIRITLEHDNNITCFWNEDIKIEKVYQNNHRLEDLEKIELQVSENTNVYFKGIGFLYIKKSDTLVIYGMKKENISFSKSFLA